MSELNSSQEDGRSLTVENIKAIEPEFGSYRVVERMFGWGRTYTYYRAKAGDIDSVFLQQRGCKAGKRLFRIASVRDYITRKMNEQKVIKLW